MQPAPRLTIAVSLSAAFMLAAFGVAGLATASDDSTAPLTTLSLPGPRVGDEAHYDYLQTTGGLEEPVIVDGPRDGLGFAFREPRVAVDINGDAHMTNSFYEISYGWYEYDDEPGEDWMNYADWTFDLDVETGEVVSYWMEQESRHENQDDGTVAVYSQGTTHLNEDFGDDPPWIYSHPCFTFNAFQDHELPVDGPMDLHEVGCSWPRTVGTFGDGYTTYIPLGIEQFGDVETVHFVQDSPVTTPHGGPGASIDDMRTGGTHVWLSEEYPYPVKIAHPMDDDDDRFDLYVLREFFRGDAPLATGDDQVDESEAVLVDSAPMTKLGPHVSGLAINFTPQDAYDAAVADSDAGLQDFLDAHPDAYTGRVHHDHRVKLDSGHDDVEVTDYRFHFTAGGTTTKVLEIHQEIRTPHDAMGRDQESTTTVTVTEAQPDMLVFPDPSLVPAEVPTVASVADVWRTLGGHDRAANTYSFSIWCGDNDDECGRPVVAVATGYTTDWERDAFTPGQVETTLGAEPESEDSVQEEDTVDVRVFEGRQSISTSTYRVHFRDAEGDEPMDAESEPVLTKSAVSADAVWAFPGAAAAAGIGASGLLIGSVVAGWPALKGGLLAPLFSRVHRSEALEHPLRRRLMEIVNGQPGIHLQAVVDASGEPRSTVLHHLRTLERTGLVVAQHAGHYTCYFSKDRAARLSIKAAPVVKAAGAKALLDAIAGDDGVSIKQAAAAAGLSLSTAYYHVRRLQDAGLVDAEDGLSVTGTGRATLRELLR